MNVGYETDMVHVKTNAIIFGVVLIVVALVYRALNWLGMDAAVKM